MGHQTATVGDTVYFWFGANDTSGSGGDGASAVFDVREAGAAAGAIPLLSDNATLLSHANYPAGCYEIAVAATGGNGFAADDTFAVFCTLAIDSQNPTGFVGSCTLTPLAKTAALATAQTDLDTITGSDGVTLATAQGLYAPSKAGDAMDLVANAVDATAIATDAITNTKIAADAIGASEFSQAAADKVWDTTARILTASTNFNDISTAEVNTQVDLALTDIHLDHLLAVDYDPASKPGVATALFNELIESDAGISRYTANALELAPTGGSAPTVAQIWDEVLDSTHAVADSAAQKIKDILVDTSTMNNISTAEVNTQVDLALTDIHLDHLLAVDYDPASKPGVATALLNELVESDAGVSRYTANALELAPTGGSAPTVAQIWDEVLDSTHSVADSAAQKIKDTLIDTANMNGSDGVTLATAQANYAPSKAGNAMDLVTNAVDTGAIATGAITADSIAANAIGSSELATDAIGSAQIAANAIGSSEIATDAIGSAQLANSAVDEIWQTVLTEGYAALGAEGTASQILYTIQQFITDSDVAGTTYTIRRLNGSSTAYVLTLDSATTPTDKNRTT